MTTITVTGHRPRQMGPAYGYDDPVPWRALQSRIEAEFARIAAERDDTRLRVITGGAQGADQCAFWAAHALKAHAGLTVTNTVFVPFAGQASRWREDGLFGQTDWRTMLVAADEVVTIARDAPSTYGEAVRAMHARNDAMLREADVVVAVTHLDPNDVTLARGGTAQTLRTCATLGIPVRTVLP